MNSTSDQDSQITTVYDVDVDTRRRSNRILGLPPGHDEDHSMSQTSHTVTHQSTNPTQAFVSPLGAALQEVASVHSASHHSTYRPVPVNVATSSTHRRTAIS